MLPAREEGIRGRRKKERKVLTGVCTCTGNAGMREGTRKIWKEGGRDWLKNFAISINC